MLSQIVMTLNINLLFFLSPPVLLCPKIPALRYYRRSIPRDIYVVAVEDAGSVADETLAECLHCRTDFSAFGRIEPEIITSADRRLSEYKPVACSFDVGAPEKVACERHACHRATSRVGGAHGRDEIA